MQPTDPVHQPGPIHEPGRTHGRDPARKNEPAPPGRPGLIPFGRIFGVPLFLTPMWVLVSLVLVVGYGPLLGRGGPAPYLLGFSVAVCLALSVLAHEVAHALAARHYRVGVRSITLELLGGVTEMDGPAPTPRAEAVIALAGPAASFLLGGVFGAFLVITDPRSVPGELVFQMTATNVLVAVFNVLPGLPLDGGRALRAGVWAVTHDEYRADVVAGHAGRVIALATFAGALAYIRFVPRASLIGMALLVAVAATLWTGANGAVQGAVMRRRVPQLRAGSLARPLHLVLTGTPLSEALRQRDDMVAAAAGGMLPSIGVANSAGRVIALLNGRKVAAIPLARRPWVDVDAASAPVGDAQRIDASSSGPDVLAAAQRNPDRDLLVTVGEDVVGVLALADIVTILRGGTPSRPPHGRSRSREPGT